MREGVRVVEVEVVDDVSVGERLDEEEFIHRRPARARGDDRMARRAVAYGSGHARLNPHPAVRVLDHRLVEDFEEEAFGVAAREGSCGRAPELCEGIDVAVLPPPFYF